MFHPLLAPPTLDQTTPPSLGALTACLSVGLDLLKKVLTIRPPYSVSLSHTLTIRPPYSVSLPHTHHPTTILSVTVSHSPSNHHTQCHCLTLTIRPPYSVSLSHTHHQTTILSVTVSHSPSNHHTQCHCLTLTIRPPYSVSLSHTHHQTTIFSVTASHSPSDHHTQCHCLTLTIRPPYSVSLSHTHHQTTILSVTMFLLQLDPPHKVGTPSKKSPSKSSPSRPRLGAPGDHKYREALCLMEHAIVLCMGQALCLLSGHTPSSHDQQLLRKELANEMVIPIPPTYLVTHTSPPSPSPRDLSAMLCYSGSIVEVCPPLPPRPHPLHSRTHGQLASQL